MMDTARSPSLKTESTVRVDQIQVTNPISHGKWLNVLYFIAEILVAVCKSASIILRNIYRCMFPPKEKSLQGEIALVTGAGHGLGRELAIQLAANGCIVVCVDINEKGNEETVRDINARYCLEKTTVAYSFVCDVSDRNQVQQLAERVQAALGRVDILVNNAGIMPVQPILRVQPTEVVDVVNVNLLSNFWTLLAFLPGMMARNHGHLVAISSMAGLCGLANKVPYSASKFAVTGLMDALTEELRLDSTKIKLTCVHPYFLNTQSDLPENLHLRIPELSPEFAAQEIVKAVRHNVETLTVPRNLLFWINVLKILPQDARHVWRDVFYTNVSPVTSPLMETSIQDHKT